MSQKKKNSRKITALFPNVLRKQGYLLPSLPGILPKAFRKSKGVQSDFVTHLLFFSLFYVILVSVVLIYASFTIFSMYKYNTEQKRRAETQLSYWETIINEHPNYPDAYYKAAIYAYQLGQKEKALVYTISALQYDPDFTEAQELKKKLEK
jgi:tetratricopeptide (TPR) repeat protein